jgi:hypothetical protein
MTDNVASVAKELDQVKRLLILLLVKLGSTSEEIGSALGVHHSRVRQMVPTGKIKKLPLLGAEE